MAFDLVEKRIAKDNQINQHTTDIKKLTTKIENNNNSTATDITGLRKMITNIQSDITGIKKTLPIVSGSKPSSSIETGKIVITNDKVFVKTGDGVIREFRLDKPFAVQGYSPANENLIWIDNSKGNETYLMKFWHGSMWKNLYSIYK